MNDCNSDFFASPPEEERTIVDLHVHVGYSEQAESLSW